MRNCSPMHNDDHVTTHTHLLYYVLYYYFDRVFYNIETPLENGLPLSYT